MIKVEVQNHGLAAIGEDNERGRYECVDRLNASRPASAQLETTQPARAMVEVQRRFGGLAPRAMVGGQFVPGVGVATTFEVCVGAPLGDRHDPPCPSELWERPFMTGLPAEFADAVLRGVTDDGGFGLPSGVLTVDRAGFDEVESSAVIFMQAAALLRRVIAAGLHHRDVEAEARAVIATW